MGTHRKVRTVSARSACSHSAIEIPDRQWHVACAVSFLRAADSRWHVLQDIKISVRTSHHPMLVVAFYGMRVER